MKEGVHTVSPISMSLRWAAAVRILYVSNRDRQPSSGAIPYALLLKWRFICLLIRFGQDKKMKARLSSVPGSGYFIVGIYFKMLVNRGADSSRRCRTLRSSQSPWAPKGFRRSRRSVRGIRGGELEGRRRALLQ